MKHSQEEYPMVLNPQLVMVLKKTNKYLILFNINLIIHVISFVFECVDDDSGGISSSEYGGDKRPHKANSCVHLRRLSCFVVWYEGIVSCKRSCSAKIASVNDGYFESVDIVVDDNGWVDFVVIAFDDWAYSVWFDTLATDGAGIGSGGTDGILNLKGGSGGISSLFVTVLFERCRRIVDAECTLTKEYL